VHERRSDRLRRTIFQDDTERPALPEWQILVEPRGSNRNPIHDRDARRVEERRHPGLESCTVAPGRQTPAWGGGHVENAGADVGLNGKQYRSLTAALRFPDVVDAGRVQVLRSVAIHVHADFDDANELHLVGRALPKFIPTPSPEHRPRGSGTASLTLGDSAIPVLIDASAAREQGRGRPIREAQRVRAPRSESGPRRIDRNGRDATLRKLGGNEPGDILIGTATVTVDHDRIATQRLGTGWKK